MEAFAPWHIMLIVGLAVLFFGGKKLPELGKGIGEGLKGFKEGMRGVTEDPPPATGGKPADHAHLVTPKAEETAVKQ